MRCPRLLLLAVFSAAFPAAATTALGESQCYELKPADFDAVPVTARDRFGTRTFPLRFPHRLCVPAGDDAGPGLDLMGYGLDADGGPSGQHVTTRFGSLTLDLLRPDLLLVPTAVDAQAPPLESPTGTASLCYRVETTAGSPKFVPIAGVEVADELETAVVDLTEPSRLCVPADVNGADPSAVGRADALLCYTTDSDSGFGDLRVHTRNRFGVDEVRLIHRRELCVPVLHEPDTTTTTTSTSTTTTTTTSTTSTRPPSTTTSSSTSLPSSSTTSTSSSSTSSTSVIESTTTSTTTLATTTTTLDLCGNGVVDAGEECDDGGASACCSATCRMEPDGTSCGDGDTCNGDERCRAGRCETAPACRSSIVLAAVTNFRADTVTLVDPGSARAQATVPAPGGPWGVAFRPSAGEIWITNRRARNITVIDVATRTVSGTIPTGRVPLGIAFDPSGTRAYVASYAGDRIEVIDAASRRSINQFHVDRGPSGVVFDATGNMLWVTSYAADTVLALDPVTGEVRARLGVGRKPTQLAVDAPRGRLYVSNFGAGTVTAIDLARRVVLTSIRVGRKPFGVAIDPERARAYVTNAGQDMLTVIDTTANTVAERRRVAAGPLGVGVDPAGRVLVTSGTAGVVSFIDPVGSATGTLVVGNLPVAFGNFVATVGTRCPDAPPCDARTSIDAGSGPLVALLDALADTIRHAVIPDTALGQALTDAVARCRDRAVHGDDTGLGRELHGIVRTLRRGTRRHGIDRQTGSQLLDLLRRAGALVRRGGR